MISTWDEIERYLTDLYSLPHNLTELRRTGSTPQVEATKKIAEIKSGLSNVSREDFHGPKLFLRLASATNRAYGGEWWFDAEILDLLETSFSRIYFAHIEKKRAIRDMLRELLAISFEWNAATEVWALELPTGQHLRGYSGPGNPQKLFANLPLSAKGNRLLVGGVRQIFFPVKNPLWIRLYESLTC